MRYLNKPTLASVATSGSYNDLTNKPGDRQSITSANGRTHVEADDSGVGKVRVDREWQAVLTDADGVTTHNFGWTPTPYDTSFPEVIGGTDVEYFLEDGKTVSEYAGGNAELIYLFTWQGNREIGYSSFTGQISFTDGVWVHQGLQGWSITLYESRTQTLKTVATTDQRNILDYTSGTTLALGTAVYRANLASDGTFPTITDTAITSQSAYFQFELELTVPSTVPSTFTGPTGWIWLDGHGLPDPEDLSGGETVCISVRLDCTARTFLASVWMVA